MTMRRKMRVTQEKRGMTMKRMNLTILRLLLMKSLNRKTLSLTHRSYKRSRWMHRLTKAIRLNTKKSRLSNNHNLPLNKISLRIMKKMIMNMIMVVNMERKTMKRAVLRASRTVKAHKISHHKSKARKDRINEIFV
jgi:hypothetical protein